MSTAVGKTGARGRLRLGLVLGLLLCTALPAAGVIPLPDRVEKAIAETNKAAGRSDAVKLEVVLGIGDRKRLAAGELVSHPSGLARLELTATAGGLVERHLLRGSEHRVARNGQAVQAPRAFLPPFFLLQADTPETLDAGLVAFGVDGDLLGLATCGELDCFVFGDKRLVAPAPEPPADVDDEIPSAEDEKQRALLEQAIEKLGDDARFLTEDAPPKEDVDDVTFYRAEPETSEVEPVGPIARLWVDMKSYEVRRIDMVNGVEVDLGPIAAFDRLRVPAWLLIREPGREEARFDVLGAKQVNAPPRAFDLDWLMAPVEVPPGPGGATDAEAPAAEPAAL